MAELDRKRLYNTWSGIPGCVGFDEKHRPVRQAGKDTLKVISPNSRVDVHLQDGKFFNAGGRELEDGEVPAEVRAWRGSHPRVPGVSFPAAQVYECPITGCDLRFTWRSIFEKHLEAHALPRQALDEFLRQLDGGAERLSVPWSESDFAGGAVPQMPEPVAVGALEPEE